MNENYSNRELDHMFADIKDQLNRIEKQTIRHNGRLTKVEMYLIIVACISGTILVMNGSELFNFLKLVI